MKKIYVDVFGTRISGQLLMQKHLREYCVKHNLYADIDTADYLVYVQLPENFDIEFWKKKKLQGKKIVFIHHYFESIDFFGYNIFKIEGALELVDLHICITKDSELYEELQKTVADKSKIIAYEQACIDQARLFNNFFVNDSKKSDSICFVGRANKGVFDFIDYCEKNEKLKNFTKTIYTSGKHEEILKILDAAKGKYEIYLDLCEDDLYKRFAEEKFVYINSKMIANATHFEIVMHEAMALGVIVILGDEHRKYITAKDSETGFVTKDFDFENVKDLRRNQSKQYQYLVEHYATEEEVMRRNVENIFSI